MLIQLLSIFLSIANASDCATGTSSQTKSSGNNCRVQKDTLEKRNNPSTPSNPKKTDTNQSKVSK